MRARIAPPFTFPPRHIRSAHRRELSAEAAAATRLSQSAGERRRAPRRCAAAALAANRSGLGAGGMRKHRMKLRRSVAAARLPVRGAAALGAVRLRRPELRAGAQSRRRVRLSARLLHGRARRVDRLRDHRRAVGAMAGSSRRPAARRTFDMAVGEQQQRRRRRVPQRGWCSRRSPRSSPSAVGAVGADAPFGASASLDRWRLLGARHRQPRRSPGGGAGMRSQGRRSVCRPCSAAWRSPPIRSRPRFFWRSPGRSSPGATTASRSPSGSAPAACCCSWSWRRACRRPARARCRGFSRCAIRGRAPRLVARLAVVVSMLLLLVAELMAAGLVGARLLERRFRHRRRSSRCHARCSPASSLRG